MQRATVNPYSGRAQTKFELSAKRELLNRGMSVTRLAEELGLSRTSVSLALNQPVLPSVKERIRAFLNL